MPDVCLVQMPFASVEHPSIGLSLLKQGVTEAGFGCRVYYPNLTFCDQVGVRRYKAVDRCFTEDLVGEWIFSKAAFPHRALDPEDYFRLVHLDFWDNAKSELLEMREQAVSFVNEVAEMLLAEKPRIVGCSSVFAQNCASLALLRVLKQRAPDLNTVLGGANCEGVMGQTLTRNFPFLDYVVSGEADLLFPSLCRQLLSGESLPDPLDGVMTRSSNGNGVAPRAVVKELDQVPKPAFDDYFRDLTASPLRDWIEPGLTLETSRGCWWGQKHHCTFCGLNGFGIGYRSKSPERVVDEFDELYRSHKVDKFEVVDNIIDVKHIKSVLPVFAQRGAPYKIFYETKSNLKREQMKLLAQAGVRWIQPGIESMHTEILKLMDKGSTSLINVCLLKWAREFGVRLSWNFLCEFPGEKDEWYLEMAEWLPLLTHLQPPGGLHSVRFDRFSPYHSNPEKYGITIEPFETYGQVYPLSDADLAGLAYFFKGIGRRNEFGKRPGLRALKAVVEDWKARFWTNGLPSILSATDKGDKVVIMDTRPIAKKRHAEYVGVEAEILRHTHRPISKSSLSRTLNMELENALTRLLEAKLLVELDGKLVNLVVEGRLPSLPTSRDFPGGVLHDSPVLSPC